MTDIEIFALIVLPAIIVGVTYIAVLLHKRGLATRQNTTQFHARTSERMTRKEIDAQLIVAFATFERIFLNPKPGYTIEQLRMIYTPLGLAPK